MATQANNTPDRKLGKYLFLLLLFLIMGAIYWFGVYMPSQEKTKIQKPIPQVAANHPSKPLATVVAKCDDPKPVAAKEKAWTRPHHRHALAKAKTEKPVAQATLAPAMASAPKTAAPPEEPKDLLVGVDPNFGRYKKKAEAPQAQPQQVVVVEVVSAPVPQAVATSYYQSPPAVLYSNSSCCSNNWNDDNWHRNNWNNNSGGCWGCDQVAPVGGHTVSFGMSGSMGTPMPQSPQSSNGNQPSGNTSGHSPAGYTR